MTTHTNPNPNAVQLKYPVEYDRYWYLVCWSDTEREVERQEEDWDRWNSEYWDDDCQNNPWPKIGDLVLLKANLKEERLEEWRLLELLYPEEFAEQQRLTEQFEAAKAAE